MRNYFILPTFSLLLFAACNTPQNNLPDDTQEVVEDSLCTPEPNTETEASNADEAVPEAVIDTTAIADTAFVNMAHVSDGFAYDMRYATDNNFLKEAVYPCANCLVRWEVAKGLLRANKILNEQGLKIKFYDCLRPFSVQQKMWAIYPDARYVANPNRSGSIHNRGAAVDITLVDTTGKELDMGTDFDHFGKEAHHDYTALSDEVIANRKLLKSTMIKAGFTALNTEWWHYLYGEKSKYPLANADLCE